MQPFLLLLLILFCNFTAALPALEHASPSSHASLLWGPYRPGIYLGIRPRLPETLLMGVMWTNADDAARVSSGLRHTCEQNDGITYGWTSYDPRHGGSQHFNDTTNRVNLMIDLIKSSGNGGEENWGLRVRGAPRSDAYYRQQTMVTFYIGSEAKDSRLECSKRPTNGPEHDLDISCTGEMPAMSKYEINVRPRLRQNEANESSVITSVQSLSVPRDTIWHAKAIFLDQLNKAGTSGTLLQDFPGHGNLHFIQLTFTGNVDVDVLFSSGSDPAPMPASFLTDAIKAAGTAFDSRFKSAYYPKPPFDDPFLTTLSRSLLSDLLGGIGFFHGSSKVSVDQDFEKPALTSTDASVKDTEPLTLFSAVPSRPFFPRGFLWDEGFHLLVILDWDLDLAVEILLSWFDLMDENGWIAREQILGPEARSRVPPEFQTQYQTYANPPTMFFVIDMFLERILGRVPYNGGSSMYLEEVKPGQATRPIPEKAKAFLENIYPKLQSHYSWFRRTQSGELGKYQYLHADSEADFTQGYRWRGRTPQHILTSGFDDYPRARTPSKDELHIDALCWVSLMARVLSKVAATLNGPSDMDAITYDTVVTKARHSAETIHWSDTDSVYCDATINPSSNMLERVCHKGYVSILPFVTNTMSFDHIGAVLNLIADPEHLWSIHGLRSLSTKDEYYATGEDYWRSPIWVNMNYLVLVRLLALAGEDGSLHRSRARQLYTELRENIVNTIAQSWKLTGFAWEQYNADTGQGQRTQQFTGWTSLIVRIMSMPQLEDQEPHPYLHRKPLYGSTRALSGVTLLFLITMAMVLAFWSRRRIVWVCSRLVATWQAFPTV
ncbi:Processing alpha glucosidase I [Elasticomyces elasticus]|nr:Processing alpha glucosidase I [Elasticomyces elasticus]